MDWVIIILGVFLAGLGFIVKSSPNLIAGYNTLSEEKKKNVDIEGLTAFMKKGFLMMGASLIVTYFFFQWIGLTVISSYTIIMIPLIGVVAIVMGSQKFDKNKSSSKNISYIIIFVVFAFVIGLLIYGSLPIRAIFEEGKINFSGMYGVELQQSEIKSIELSDKLPAISYKINGFSFGDKHKGYYSLKPSGKAHLLLQSSSPPLIIFTKYNGEKVMVNFSTSSETKDFYNSLKLLKK